MPDELDKALAAVFGDDEDTPNEEQEEPGPEPAEEEKPQDGTPEPEQEVDEETTEEEEAPAEEPEPPLLAGKYKTAEELERAYLEAQSKLGEQGNELGELRSLREEFNELRNLMEDASAPPISDLPEWLSEDVLEAPEKAREAAIWVARHQPQNLDAVMEAWYEVKPRAAAAFEREVELSQLRAELEEELKPVKEIPAQLQQDRQQYDAQAAFNEVWASVKVQNPDLEEFAEEIVKEANEAPELAAVFHGTDPDAQSRVLQTLLRSARYRRAETAELGAAVTQQASEEAKAQAKVVSATSTKGRQAPKKSSTNDLILEVFDREAGFVTE